jgi:hypothetical protein
MGSPDCIFFEEFSLEFHVPRAAVEEYALGRNRKRNAVADFDFVTEDAHASSAFASGEEDAVVHSVVCRQ